MSGENDCGHCSETLNAPEQFQALFNAFQGLAGGPLPVLCQPL